MEQPLQQAVWQQSCQRKEHSAGIRSNKQSGYGSIRWTPPVKVHCSLLAEEAIHAALWDYAEKNGIKIEGLENSKTDISEGEEEEEY